MNTYARIKIRVNILLLLKLQNNFPQKFVLSRYVTFKEYEAEIKQGNNRGKNPIASLVSHAVSTLTGFAENELLEWGRTFSGFWGSENSGMSEF